MWFIFLPRLRFSLSLTLPYPIGNSLPFTSLRSVTVGSGRGFLEGDTRRGQARKLLEQRLCPVPVVAAADVHVDATTVEVQEVRVETIPRESTWRPIVAVAANDVQMIIVVATQGGQVEIFVCIGGGRKARVDTTIGVEPGRCTHVGCTVGRFLGVVIMLWL